MLCNNDYVPILLTLFRADISQRDNLYQQALHFIRSICGEFGAIKKLKICQLAFLFWIGIYNSCIFAILNFDKKCTCVRIYSFCNGFSQLVDDIDSRYAWIDQILVNSSKTWWSFWRNQENMSHQQGWTRKDITFVKHG